MSADEEIRPVRRKFAVFIPLGIFLALAAVFALQLASGRDQSIVPSALIDRPVPETNLPPLQGSGVAGIETGEFAGRVTLLNVWASWCVPCRDEHPLLMNLADDGRFRLTGMNYKDAPENALRFIRQLGNPYDAIGVDESGRAGIDWGVYGVPETFVIGPDATIIYKHVGPLTPAAIEDRLMPVIEKALGQAGSG